MTAEICCIIIVMKCTGVLTVYADSTLGQYKLIINPNDGYDLGLLQRHNYVKIFPLGADEQFAQDNGEYVPGQLNLENTCPNSSVQISPKYWKKIGKPKKLKLNYDNSRLLMVIG